MGKYDVSLKDLGLDDLVAAHPVTVATTFEPPEQPPVRQPVAPKPSVVAPQSYAHLRGYISWAGWLGKQGHYFGAGLIIVSILHDNAALLASGFCGLMASTVAFATANLLQIAIDSKDSLAVIENKFRS